ncbi:uncharacterized protein LOC125842490 isoform X2 [Solanum stenotomum]|uniref:uncharacterized protein LOC125842490 isoform X2 n=1 Tax=Solanum stenotomum TaxID=172797 RepID=UPI0020D0A928|nr:uncharacterized protein LOC125842490 isoform X2 [Solanum stenotomum]
MSAETKPVINSLTRSIWNSGKAYDLKPMASSSISQASSIPELISYLKSAFRDKEFSLVEGILMDREKQLRTEIQNLKRDFDSVKTGRDLAEKDQAIVDLEKLNMENRLKDMQRKNEELKNEKAEVEAKLKMYLEKFKELESRVSLQEEEAAKNRAVDVSVIQKMVEDLEAEDDDVVEVDSKASGADGDLQEKQLSPPRAPSVDSTANGNGSGKSRDEGSGNTDLISTKMNLVNCPDVQTLHPMPFAGGSAQVNSNVSNIEKKSCRSEEADPLLINLACENRAPTIDLSACEAKGCLNTASGRAGSSTVVHISDSDDENAKACVSKSNDVGRNLTFPHQIKEEDVKETSVSKRKRSLCDSDNGGGSSFSKLKTRSIQELNRDGKLAFSYDNSHKPVFVRRCDDKDGGKSYSQLSSRRSDLYKLDGTGDDSSSDSENDPLSDKSMNMLIQSITKRKIFSSEDDLRSSFEKDPELCMNAICALYRHQISPNISSKGFLATTRQGLNQSDKISIAALGEYLMDGDPENKLRKAVEEVRPKDHAECKRLATKYCDQLYQIYLNKEDRLFLPISKF